ncbi:two-component sensor histidine kinase [Merismopedia glauca CCAP 1448/3]|uniref:histidine kinase n=2 Tax=Merismopedia TaxID=53402 RepID=A0A2T1BYV2_9CYAN|nr:two-component sensor histidine kinase [Merismopedia glauca CCAP 1448/3]
MGYLYVGAILLADTHTSSSKVRSLAALAILVTILNLIIPGIHPITIADIINRLVAAIALAVTIWLLEANRDYQQTVATQEYKLQSQLKMADLKEDFAATLTHDLRTPLLGAVETIKAFQSEKFGQITTAQRRVLSIMMTSHQTTIELVQTLSDVYKHDVEGLSLQTEVIDLVTVAEQAILELNQLASNRQITLHLGYSNSDFRQACWVNGDRVQLYRVFLNLILNAINHSLRGGKIEIIFAPHGSDRMVEVRDTGQGIKLEELPLLFDRFYQANSDRHTKGSGLGLYLSRQIIEAHQGKIWAETRSPQGAIFKFTLPAHFPTIR